MGDKNTNSKIKQKKLAKLRHRVAGAVIMVMHDSIRASQPGSAGNLARQLLQKYQVDTPDLVLVDEDATKVQGAIKAAIAGGARVILTCGGTGVTKSDITPQATEPLLAAHLDAIRWQIAQQGLSMTPLASLSRGLVGVTSQDSDGVLIVNSAGSRGGVKDTITVVGPLIPHVLEQLDPDTFKLVTEESN